MRLKEILFKTGIISTFNLSEILTEDHIDYLEHIKGIGRTLINFCDFNKENLKDYLYWMDKEKMWNSRTSNLRMTAIRALLSFASEESADITPIYMGCNLLKI